MCTHSAPVFMFFFLSLSCRTEEDGWAVIRPAPDGSGELAQLARASALQAEGQGFKPPILQNKT